MSGEPPHEDKLTQGPLTVRINGAAEELLASCVTPVSLMSTSQALKPTPDVAGTASGDDRHRRDHSCHK